MKHFKFFFAILGLLSYVQLSGQTCNRPTVFTWEGAVSGNKAIWKADDSLNIYRNISGVDVQVKLIDSFKQNTTTQNPSEFGDYTKTNTFFGKGSLAFQIGTQAGKRASCLEFSFSKNIVLDSFNVWDIDFISYLNNSNLYSSFQDSVSFFASNALGNVRVIATPKSNTPSYDIIGQSLLAKFLPGKYGDLRYTDPKGAVTFSTTAAITKFTICYSNGSADDGYSNSQAMRISEFGFCEVLGSISGAVLEYQTGRPIAGSSLSIHYMDGSPVLDSLARPITIITSADGGYVFKNLSLGTYIIKQINGAGFESVQDNDFINDDKSEILLSLTNFVNQNVNFYDKLASPLPVNILSFEGKWVSEGKTEVVWKVENEWNNDYFIVSLSADGISYKEVGRVKSYEAGTKNQTYSLLFDNEIIGKSFVNLAQVDLDGTKTHLGLVKLVADVSDIQISISPNPSSRDVNVHIKGANDENISYEIVDILGKLMAKGMLHLDDYGSGIIDISSFSDGAYYVRFEMNGIIKTQKLIKS